MNNRHHKAHQNVTIEFMYKVIISVWCKKDCQVILNTNHPDPLDAGEHNEVFYQLQLQLHRHSSDD